MSDIYSSVFNTPLSDFAYFLAPYYRQDGINYLCSKFELKFMDCLEAYGTRKAREKCVDVLYDMYECRHCTFQKLRATAIYNERMKKYKEGKLDRPFEENPPLDSYMYMS